MKKILLSAFIGLATFTFAQELSLEELDKKEYHKWDEVADVPVDEVYGILFSMESEIPNNLAQFPNLHKINLEICPEMNLDLELPKLKQLDHLAVLAISANYTDHFPEIILEFTSLKALELSGLSEMGDLPEEISQLVNLERLQLGSGLAGGIGMTHLPKSIVELPKLKVLFTYYNADFIMDSHVYELPALEELWVDDVEGLDLGLLGRSYPRLKFLFLYTFEGTRLEGIEQLTGLEELTMGYSETLQTLDGLQHLNALRDFTLHVNPNLNKEEEIEHIAKLPNLVKLDLMVARACEKKLNLPSFGFNSLEDLSVSNRSNISLKHVLNNVRNMSSLHTLKIDGFKEEKMPATLYTLVNIEHLYIYRCSVLELSSNISNLNLKSLHLFQSDLKKLPAELSRMKSLEELTLSYTKISDYDAVYLRLKARGIKVEKT